MADYLLNNGNYIQGNLTQLITVVVWELEQDKTHCMIYNSDNTASTTTAYLISEYGIKFTTGEVGQT